MTDERRAAFHVGVLVVVAGYRAFFAVVEFDLGRVGILWVAL